MSGQSAANFARLVAEHDRRIAELERGGRTAQLAHSSIENGYINAYDNDGRLRQVLGRQPDGTWGASHHNAPPPDPPSVPQLTPGMSSLIVTWDGTRADGAPYSVDFDHVNVYMTDEDNPDFAVESGTLAGEISQLDTKYPLAPLDSATVYSVRFTAVNTSGAESDAGAGATAQPNQVVAQDLLDGIVDTVNLADDAVKQAKIDAGAVGETEIADDSVGTPKLVALCVEAAKIAAGAVLTEKLAADAVTAEKIAALAVTAGKIAANAITAGTIEAGAVTADKLAALLVLASELRSPNYDPGKAGFRIDGTAGTAELNDLHTYGHASGPDASYDQIAANDAFFYRGVDMADILDARPPPLTARGFTRVTSSTITGETLVASLTFDAEAGHEYLVFYRWTLHGVGNTVYSVLRCHGAAGRTISPSDPTKEAYEQVLPDQRHRSASDVTSVTADEDGPYTVGIIVDPDHSGDGIVFDAVSGGDALKVSVHDQGHTGFVNDMTLTSAYAPNQPPPPGSASFQRYSQSNNSYSGSDLISSNSVMHQGSGALYTGNAVTYMNFDLSELVGLDPDILATFEVYMKMTWTATDVAVALVGYSEGTTSYDDVLRVQFTKGQGRWINLKGTAIAAAALAGTLTRIDLGPAPSGADQFECEADGHLSGQGAQIRAAYYN